MRLNTRITLGPFTFFFMVSQTQRLEGITSKCIDEPPEKHLHYIFWDLEKCSLEQAVQTLQNVQFDFKLGVIFIVSDLEGSYRAWCFSKRPWLEYLHILLHTDYVDYGFLVWTFRRGAATARISDKVGRPPQQIVAVLRGYEETVFPEKFCLVTYDTGLEKKGTVITVG